MTGDKSGADVVDRRTAAGESKRSTSINGNRSRNIAGTDVGLVVVSGDVTSRGDASHLFNNRLDWESGDYGFEFTDGVRKKRLVSFKMRTRALTHPAQVTSGIYEFWQGCFGCPPEKPQGRLILERPFSVAGGPRLPRKPREQRLTAFLSSRWVVFISFWGRLVE